MAGSVGVNVYERSIGQTTTIDSNYYAAFVGKDFTKGEGNKALLVTSLSSFKSRFGLPTNENYNEWFQVENYLRNAGAIYVTRAIDETGTTNLTNATTISTDALADDSTVTVDSVSNLFVNANIVINDDLYTITDITGTVVEITPVLTGPVLTNTVVHLATPAYNAISEVETSGGTVINLNTKKSVLRVIPNYEDYKNMELSIPFSDNNNTKLRITAKNPGSWANNTIKVAIANPSDFAVSTNTAFGNALTGYYNYYPSAADNEIGVIVQDTVSGDIIAYKVSLTPGAKDDVGRSTYIEDVINAQDSYIYIKDNTTLSGVASKINGNEVELTLGNDGKPGKDEVARQYQEVYGNPENLSIDVFIANEIANVEVLELASSLGETLAVLGARYEDCVGMKTDKAVENVYNYCNTGDLNISSKYGAFYGNYMEIYDTYNDKNRWVNMAGICAGLRIKVNTEVGPWGVNFGLEQYGQIVGINKLAFNPDKQQRDLLYKVHCNPVVTFPGQGTVIWGNRTLWRKDDPFSKLHVRCSFNVWEKTIRNSAKYVIGKPNDNITRSLFSSTVNPVFETAQAKRGVKDFAIYYPPITDDTQFDCTFYIQMIGIVETVNLYFTAVDNSISISEVIGRA